MTTKYRRLQAREAKRASAHRGGSDGKFILTGFDKIDGKPMLPQIFYKRKAALERAAALNSSGKEVVINEE